MKILHFADAHIDMANYGRHDPQTGLPLRVLDFLKALDTIVDAAITERVDLVIFAGDAYKDRSPAPTYQREWGRRIMRLSQAGIPTVLLVGNHDLSPSIGRAHAIQEFETLQVPQVHVIARPMLLTAQQLGIPLQVVGLPWVSRSALMAATQLSAEDPQQVYAGIEERLSIVVQDLISQADPNMPLVLTAHASVEGATYGGERMVMLGSDLVLSGGLVRNPRFSYVALGHIHKPQNLNEGAQPPVIYPGSIERVDFGEARDDKFYVVATVQPGQPTQVEWRKLEGRTFIDRYCTLENAEDITTQLKRALPAPKQLADAVVRLTVEYPRDYEKLIDEAALRAYTENAFEFHLVKRPQIEARIRLDSNETIAHLSPLDLLERYWQSTHTTPDELQQLQQLAQEIMRDDNQSA